MWDLRAHSDFPQGDVSNARHWVGWWWMDDDAPLIESNQKEKTGPEFDLSQPTKSIMYSYANILYGWAMSQPIPDSDTIWVS